jgi:hypothetical protein
MTNKELLQSFFSGETRPKSSYGLFIADHNKLYSKTNSSLNSPIAKRLKTKDDSRGPLYLICSDTRLHWGGLKNLQPPGKANHKTRSSHIRGARRAAADVKARCIYVNSYKKEAISKQLICDFSRQFGSLYYEYNNIIHVIKQTFQALEETEKILAELDLDNKIVIKDTENLTDFFTWLLNNNSLLDEEQTIKIQKLLTLSAMFPKE